MIKPRKAAALHQAAEDSRVKSRQKTAAALNGADLLRGAHELEMENEALRRTQDELAAERARYFDLYELAPVAYCTLSEQGLIVHANRSFAARFGVDRDVLIGHAFARLVVPKDAAIYGLFRRQATETAQASACEVRMFQPDGRPFWAHLVASVGNDAVHGPVLRVVVSDLSERKRAEEAIQEHREFSQMIAENIGDFIAILDRDGRRLYNSPSYKLFFGGLRDLRGTDSFADIHPDDQERVKRVFRETVQTGIGVQTDYRLLIADGSVRDIESRGSVIKDNDGRVVRVVVISHDITERKQKEALVAHLAFHDALTRLPNRRLLADRLSQNMAASARSGCHGAVMFIDLDDFKRLNDTHGHAAGDLLLVEVAERLKHCVREMDTVARIGGDEFVVMISELDVDESESLAQAAAIAEKIRVALAVPHRLAVRRAGKVDVSVDYRCTASIGVALFASHPVSQEGILALADAAMYQAKAAGHDSICFHCWATSTA